MKEEKRKNVEHKIQELLNELTLAQKLSLNDVGQFGYQLAFIRNMPEGKTAIVTLDKSIISIAEDGELDRKPDIKLRN
ncbi:hypothetical protein CJF42_07790 [Pseudoalteromonas sp. NBT06-2]|uniref:hypothetical protein n=1 Tax=Pseudoalteromonas sp. NBT06-2 TaxID=2025950 RepID=UPI000BA6FDE4|nr:hypothetical protein [Pseudoalteromonas sp. NBT06-2]PAJ74967.1 hypothetical protein CJF42_07790 [Pseudoalteromonas sp. NBT06-2]